jgi:hypothetical protein
MRVTHHRQHYVAVVRKEADFRAHLPDFPDIVTTGPTARTSVRQARGLGKGLGVCERALSVEGERKYFMVTESMRALR